MLLLHNSTVLHQNNSTHCPQSSYIKYPENVDESLDIALSFNNSSHTWSPSFRWNMAVLLATPMPDRLSAWRDICGMLFSCSITKPFRPSVLRMCMLKRYVPFTLHTKWEVISSKAFPVFRKTLSNGMAVSWATGPNTDFLVTKNAILGVLMGLSPGRENQKEGKRGNNSQ